MEFLLVRREAFVALAEHRLDLALEVADLEHVHVVVRARLRVRREVDVLLDDALEGLPVRADVAGRAPRLRDVRGPRAGERPAAFIGLLSTFNKKYLFFLFSCYHHAVSCYSRPWVLVFIFHYFLFIWL